MRKTAVLLLALACAACGKPADKPVTAKRGQPAPAVVIEKTLQGDLKSLKNWDELKGKAVVLEFWGTDCGPCVDNIGHMNELVVGDPAFLSTDVGPAIDAQARDLLERHAREIVRGARWHHRCVLGPEAQQGTFVAPLAVQIDSLGVLEREVFGPILHVVTYRARDLESLVDAINATGYGLTFGIHSRIDGTVQRVAARVSAGNVYVNRNIIGAIVGTQPFGGCGLSGTGPKAGGPRYLHRFAHERTLTINTSAVGGNASLLAME